MTLCGLSSFGKEIFNSIGSCSIFARIMYLFRRDKLAEQRIRRAALFDLDGTLIDTTPLILACFEHSWRSVCRCSHSREKLIETFGIPLREAMRLLLAQVDGDGPDSAEVIDRLLVEYRRFNLANHDTIAKPFDGVCETISALKHRGYSIGVVSSKSRELGQRGLRLCRIDQMVDTMVFLEDTDRHKPDPYPILTALERLNVTADSAAYVGDSPFDMAAGRAAGVKTVAALWGPVPRPALEAEKPDHFAQSAAHLLEIFT